MMVNIRSMVEMSVIGCSAPVFSRQFGRAASGVRAEVQCQLERDINLHSQRLPALTQDMSNSTQLLQVNETLGETALTARLQHKQITEARRVNVQDGRQWRRRTHRIQAQ